MKTQILIATAFILIMSTSKAETLSMTCQGQISHLDQRTDIQIPQFRLDILSVEGEMSVKPIGQINKTNVAVQIYMSDQKNRTYNLQIAEVQGEMGYMLADTQLNIAVGEVTSLSHRFRGSQQVVNIACFRNP